MNERTLPPAVIADQHAASDPATSVWVPANAGAGKTHVLAQRVIRLLLDGTDPAKILCLTFTKAAAANMANRIFETLGQWIALDDAALTAAIRSTGARSTNAKQRARARRLFACALETPGGLKVQTIHGFCTRLLQQFPFEANVAARFHVLEEIEQKQLLEQIRRDVLFEATSRPDSEIGRALTAVIPMVSDFAFEEGLREAIGKRDRIELWLERAGGIGPAASELAVALGIAATDTLEAVEAEIVNGPHLPLSQWHSAATLCAASSSMDKRQGERLVAAAAAAGSTRVERYLSVFFTDQDETRQSIITASLAKSKPELARQFDAEKTRIAGLCQRRRAVIIRDRTRSLLTIAAEIIARYAAEKNLRGQLDYDDLISRTDALLGSVDALWVHYKLDLGIDHLLIDEAQDTSPAQWSIIRKFVSEFTAGAGARSTVKRSIFAVGDDKQSIFSFQGAAPEAFDEQRRYFENAHVGAEQSFKTIPFKYSFRSAPIVLQAVDTVFQQPAAHAGLTVDPVPPVHEAVREAAPGVVELWDLVEPDDKQQPDPWDAPFDESTETSPRVKLARQIARAVKTWITRGDLVGDGAQRHAARPGDILILVRQRGPLFEAIIRALKNADIAVAGADRLLLTEHIAVMDLLALADAVLLPADDLALAAVLKSPLFNVSEEELYKIAHGRVATLRDAITAQRPGLAERFDTIERDALRLSPFAFYAGLLGAGGARRAFLARLGLEANDALDEFLNLALDYERRETSSLQGFVAWMRTASAEVKRDMEIARDEVRVMTVHGAKGLEAPIVVLADTTTLPAGPTQYQPRLLSLPAQHAAPGTPDRIAWMPTKRDDVPPTAAARSAATLAAENEYRRLLYVAMTRAADRLVVCGAVGEKSMPPGCWYDLIQRGLESGLNLTEEPADFGEGQIRRYRKAPLDAAPATAAMVASSEPLPTWLRQPAPQRDAAAAALRPSYAHVATPAPTVASATDSSRQHARERGVAMHRLMQSLPDLPPERRGEAARRFLSRQSRFSDGERDDMLARVMAPFSDPRFAALFQIGSHAEVPIVGRLGDRPVSGVVDRLVLTPDAVLIADYKTDREPPQSLAEAKLRCPGYLTQLALYRAVLMRLYPDRPVGAALLWTEIPELMEIPQTDLDAALRAVIST